MNTKTKLFAKFIFLALLSALLLFCGCSKREGSGDPGTITYSGTIADFLDVGINSTSAPQTLMIRGLGISGEIVVSVSGDFEVASDNYVYANKITIPATMANNNTIILVRCKPKNIGKLSGLLTVTSNKIAAKTYTLSATGVNVLHSLTTFNKVRHAFGGGFTQSSIAIFTFPVKPEKVEKIRMFVKLACPAGGCNAWDVFANIKVKDPATSKWLEIGRYITPYGVDNSQLTKGFMIDVTDFKSLLTGEVNLRSFIETWGADGWLLTLNFEITEGIPDYKYYTIGEIIQYNNNSLEGIPYGEANNFVVEKSITLPSNTEKCCLRTIITGWGHATPTDPDGRPCAEWCFRTNKILIGGVPKFTHVMNGCGCSTNPVRPQGGNWSPDRAGWCPGMEVPVRTDVFESSMAGASFGYKYQLEPWTNNFKSTADNQHAYYAISSFVVVKSNTPFTSSPVVN